MDGDAEAENFEGFNGSGRTVTLQMLLAANVLQPGRAAMTIEYLVMLTNINAFQLVEFSNFQIQGQKFVGDLLPDGKIKSHETETIFLSPSAWAMHCKRIINPEKKSGCGWASVKYKGKKLDAYKATWMRKCAQQNNSTPSEGGRKVAYIATTQLFKFALQMNRRMKRRRNLSHHRLQSKGQF